MYFDSLDSSCGKGRLKDVLRMRWEIWLGGVLTTNHLHMGQILIKLLHVHQSVISRKSVNSWLHFMEIGPMVGFNQMNSLLLSFTMVGC